MLSKLQRLICLLLLAVYTATGTSAVPAAVMLLATLDGSHSVFVNESQEGTQLILHHRADSFTPHVCDHASVLTRVIVRLCRPGGEGDHCMLSAHVAATINTPSDEAKRDIADAPMVNDQATMRLESLNVWPVCNTICARLGWAPLPAAMQPQHMALKSVQLLI